MNKPHTKIHAASRLLTLFAATIILLFFVLNYQSQAAELRLGTAVNNNADLLCHFGVNALEDPNLTNLEALRVGWYMNFTTDSSPPQPGGMEYMQTIRFSPNVAAPGYTYQPGEAALINIINQNPGVKWILGNEPDSPFQDNLIPEVYARAYHDLYHLIKNQDPTAQIIVGSIIQPTPVRLLYLDMILASYYEQFNTAMPTDGWSFHNYILNEASCDYLPEMCWGALIPPGVDWDYGEIWTIDDNDRIDVFIERIVRFRQWMYNRGYAGQPLYLTEYGILMPHDPLNDIDYGYPPSRVNAYMNETFDYMLTATDPKLGDPNDNYKLVQQWSWFSTTDTSFNGDLFDPTTYIPTEMGENYMAYTSGINTEVDFYPRVVGTASPTPYSQSQPVTVTLRAIIANAGNLANAVTATVQFYDGDPLNGGSPIGPAQLVSLSGCGSNQEITVQWPNVLPGAYQVYVQVTPDSGVIETNDNNNLASGTVLVASHQIFLPSVKRLLP